MSMRIFERTFVITRVLYWLAAGVAAIGLVSALLAWELERSHEIAILRSLGLTPGGAALLIEGQTGFMGLVALRGGHTRGIADGVAADRRDQSPGIRLADRCALVRGAVWECAVAGGCGGVGGWGVSGAAGCDCDYCCGYTGRVMGGHLLRLWSVWLRGWVRVVPLGAIGRGLTGPLLCLVVALVHLQRPCCRGACVVGSRCHSGHGIDRRVCPGERAADVRVSA